jgi:hypothetical protein
MYRLWVVFIGVPSCAWFGIIWVTGPRQIRICHTENPAVTGGKQKIGYKIK